MAVRDRQQFRYPPLLFDIPNAAYYLGISEDTLHKLELSEVIPSYQNLGKKVFHRDDLDAYADSLRKQVRRPGMRRPSTRRSYGRDDD